MKAEELLKPRFEVIADYPFNPHKVGDILSSKFETIHQTTTSYRNEFGDNCDEAHWCMPVEFEKYPSLFRKLNWWENRKKEDMPKRLICKAIPGDTEVMEIEKWNMDTLFGFTSIVERKGCSLYSFNPEYGYFPVDAD